MHEMSLAEGVVQIIKDHAAANHFERVTRVWVEIGALSHVEPDALAFCFDAVTRGTLAEGATMEIIRIPGKGWCMVCSKPVEVATRYDACPQCGGHQIQVTAGEEMRVKELEVE